MLSLLKTFGKGLLYVISLPFILLILAGYMIYGVFYFLFLSIKSLVLFFKGKTIYSELEEDIKAKEILTGLPHQTVIDPIEKEESSEDEPSLEIPMYTIPSVITLDTNSTNEENNQNMEQETTQKEEDTLPKFEALEEPAPMDTVYSKIIIGEEEEIPVSENNSKRIFDDDILDDDPYIEDSGVTIKNYEEDD